MVRSGDRGGALRRRLGGCAALWESAARRRALRLRRDLRRGDGRDRRVEERRGTARRRAPVGGAAKGESPGSLRGAGRGRWRIVLVWIVPTWPVRTPPARLISKDRASGKPPIRYDGARVGAPVWPPRGGRKRRRDAVN